MLDGKFNIYWKKGEKEKIRLAKWITNDTDSDEEELAQKYIPTAGELEVNQRKNEEPLAENAQYNRLSNRLENRGIN